MSKLTNRDIAAFRKQITAAFKMVRTHDIWARQNHKCCGSCGFAALPDHILYTGDKPLGDAVFYSAQDRESMKSGKFYISFTTKRAANLLVMSGILSGILATWNGDEEERVCFEYIFPCVKEEV